MIEAFEEWYKKELLEAVSEVEQRNREKAEWILKFAYGCFKAGYQIGKEQEACV